MQGHALSLPRPDVERELPQISVNHLGDIRFGLAGIKGLGDNAVQAIIDERERGGKYLSVFDFFERVNLNICNRKNLECLALSGAFDSFGDCAANSSSDRARADSPTSTPSSPTDSRFQMESEESTNRSSAEAKKWRSASPKPRGL